MRRVLERCTHPDGIELALHRWEPDAPTALCFVLHGYADHARRYEQLATALAERGIAAWAPDLRGHGLSGGPRADVRAFHDFVRDLAFVADLARTRHPGLPTLLFGHSAGGATALAYVLEHPGAVRALAVSGPYLRPAQDPPGWLRGLVARLARVAPGLPVQPLAATLISRDRSFVDAYRTDPLVYHGWVKARMAHELIEVGPRVLARAGELTLPLLIVQGGADGLAHPDGARALAAAAASQDLTLRVLDGVFHEPLSSEDGDVLAGEIADWLAARAGAGAPAGASAGGVSARQDPHE